MSSMLQMLLLLSQNYFTTLSGRTTGFVNIWKLTLSWMMKSLWSNFILSVCFRHEDMDRTSNRRFLDWAGGEGKWRGTQAGGYHSTFHSPPYYYLKKTRALTILLLHSRTLQSWIITLLNLSCSIEQQCQGTWRKEPHYSMGSKL